jgi:hypothetical protein
MSIMYSLNQFVNKVVMHTNALVVRNISGPPGGNTEKHGTHRGVAHQRLQVAHAAGPGHAELLLHPRCVD